MNKWISVFALLIFLGVGVFLLLHTSNSPKTSGDYTRQISIQGVPLQVAVAETENEREQGLSGRAGLSEGQGMLFVFEKDDIYSFWMKDMLFSIDILWIDAEGKIVFLKKDVSPQTYPTPFTPDSPARYVLEVPAGFAMRHEITAGSKVDF